MDYMKVLNSFIFSMCVIRLMVFSHEQVVSMRVPAYLQHLLLLAIKLATWLFQNHTLLAGKCPCCSTVLVSHHRGGRSSRVCLVSWHPQWRTLQETHAWRTAALLGLGFRQSFVHFGKSIYRMNSPQKQFQRGLQAILLASSSCSNCRGFLLLFLNFAGKGKLSKLISWNGFLTWWCEKEEEILEE